MFGPLPRVHRIVVGVVVVGLGIAGSLLTGWYLPTEVVGTTAAAIGLVIGIVLAIFLLQAPPSRSQRRQTPRGPQRR